MTLSGHQLLLFLVQVSGLLLLALLLGRAAQRIGFAATAGELAAGIIVGPSVLGNIAPGLTGWVLPARADQTLLLAAVSQLAVLLMVGISGGHLDLHLIRRRGAAVAAISAGAFVLPLGLGIGAGFLLPQRLVGDGSERTTFALFLGAALAVSAIPVIAKVLTDLDLIHRDVGQLTMASAAAQDAVAWMLLSLIATMAVSGLHPRPVAVSVLCLAGFLLVAAVAGRFGVRPALRAAARSPEAGPTIATAVFVILGGAALAHALALEAVFGAFIAGVLLAAHRAAAGRGLAPLRTVTMAVLAPIFLATVGLQIDLGELADPSVLVTGLAVLALATAGKLAGGYVGARLAGLGHWEGVAVGAGLNARGVVEIVVAAVGLRLGILSTAMYTIVVMTAVTTSMMAPPMLRWAMGRVEDRDGERERAAALSGDPVPALALHRDR